MADIIRSAKSGNNWSQSELDAYHISIVEQDQETFFEHPLPPYTGQLGFIENERCIQGLDASSLALIKRLDLAMDEDEESAVDQFAAEALRMLDYETESTLIHLRKNIRLTMCGSKVHAKTNVCVLDVVSGFILFIQENKVHSTRPIPQPQLVAEAIAVFQSNNARREALDFAPLEEMVVPAVIMIGTFPRFYKIRVTAELNDCILSGLFPDTETIIYRHTPNVDLGDGMRPLDNRKLILRCFQAFRQYVLPAQAGEVVGRRAWPGLRWLQRRLQWLAGILQWLAEILQWLAGILQHWAT